QHRQPDQDGERDDGGGRRGAAEDRGERAGQRGYDGRCKGDGGRDRAEAVHGRWSPFGRVGHGSDLKRPPDRTGGRGGARWRRTGARGQAAAGAAPGARGRGLPGVSGAIAGATGVRSARRRSASPRVPAPSSGGQVAMARTAAQARAAPTATTASSATPPSAVPSNSSGAGSVPSRAGSSV